MRHVFVVHSTRNYMYVVGRYVYVTRYIITGKHRILHATGLEYYILHTCNAVLVITNVQKLGDPFWHDIHAKFKVNFVNLFKRY